MIRIEVNQYQYSDYAQISSGTLLNVNGTPYSATITLYIIRMNCLVTKWTSLDFMTLLWISRSSTSRSSTCIACYVYRNVYRIASHRGCVYRIVLHCTVVYYVVLPCIMWYGFMLCCLCAVEESLKVVCSLWPFVYTYRRRRMLRLLARNDVG